MNHGEKRTYYHACPKNCFSSCTFVSTVENRRIAQLQGDSAHPYTQGKLCAKGFALMEMNNHPERLKYPYYQAVKGSGKFTKISWEKAYELIISEMMNIYKENNNFLPLGFHKGTGNLGVHHRVTEQFFAGLPEATKIADTSSTLLSGGKYEWIGSSPMTMKEAAMIIIWGANPAATNIHLVPFLVEAKVKGTKIVVIDPLYTQTAELADLYIQLRPGSDGYLARLLLKDLNDSGKFFEKLPRFLDANQAKQLSEWIQEIDREEAIRSCDVPEEAVNLLLEWLKSAGPAAHVIGNGILRQANAKRSLLSIESLAAFLGDFVRPGGGIFMRKGAMNLFDQTSDAGQTLHLDSAELEEQLAENSLEMVWISGENPLTHSANLKVWKKILRTASLVVAVDHFLTPTAQMANLVLPTTTLFEESDLVVNDFHGGMAYNEKAVRPYYESRSEWRMMTDLAERLDKELAGVHQFPFYASEDEYLNAQLNDAVLERYGIKSLEQLKGRQRPLFPVESGEKVSAKDTLKKVVIHLLKGIRGDGEKAAAGGAVFQSQPSEEFPFWLLTLHHPYRLNSQFHFLQLAEEKEAYVGIHEEVARELGIFNGEVIRLYNSYGSIEIKAVYSTKVAENSLFIYKGWYPNSDVEVNRLFPSVQRGEASVNGLPIGHTFVNVEKL